MSITFYPSGKHDDDDLSLNVSNSNGMMLLRNLGIEADYCGSVTPELLLYAIAHSDPIDSGTVTVIEKGEGATMYDMGVRPGYMAEKYAILTEIANEAKRLGVDVVWA